MNVVDSLAGGDVLKWENVLELSWATVQAKRQINLTKYKVDKRYGDIKAEKAKHK